MTKAEQEAVQAEIKDSGSSATKPQQTLMYRVLRRTYQIALFAGTIMVVGLCSSIVLAAMGKPQPEGLASLYPVLGWCHGCLRRGG